MFFSLLHRKWSYHTWAPKNNLLSSSECICSHSIFISLHSTSEKGTSIFSSQIDANCQNWFWFPVPPTFLETFLSIITILSSSVFPSQLIIPFGQKISKKIFFIFLSCTFLKFCFLSVLSNSFNRFYLFHASYLLFKTIYSMTFASPLFHLKRNGRIKYPSPSLHKYSPRKVFSSDSQSCPRLGCGPHGGPCSLAASTALSPPTAWPTSPKHHPPKSLPQCLLPREPKLRRNIFKPSSVNSHSLLSSQIFSFLPQPLSVIAVFSALIFWLLY